MKETNKMNIDEMLTRQEKSGLNQWAKATEDESLSMAWRSELNLKLMATEAKKSKKVRTVRWMWGGSLATGLAAITVLTVLMPGLTSAPKASPKSATLVSEMVATHQESATLSDVSGTGAVDRETSLDYLGSYGDDDLL